MSTYRVIRVSSDYQMIVVVSPADAEPLTEGNKYWFRNDCSDVLELTEISETGAMCYFSGHADGMGWGERPDQEFDSLQAVEDWRQQAAEEYAKKILAEFQEKD